MKRLLPLKWCTNSLGAGRPIKESVARYRPAGHPSVRSMSSDMASSDNWTPSAAKREYASAVLNARSSARISDNCPAARILPSRRVGSARVIKTRCACSGRCLTKKSICLLHSADRTMWKSSMTITTFWDRTAIASTMRGSTPVSMSWPPAETNPATSRAILQPARSRAVAICVHSRTGSLSGASSEIQATISGRAGDASHCVTTVVLP